MQHGEPPDGEAWPTDAGARASLNTALECSTLAADVQAPGDRMAECSGQRCQKDPSVDPKVVRALQAARRARDKAFYPGLFGEPAWDILLELYLARLENRNEVVSDACVAAAVPATTAWRCLGTLTALGFVERTRDARDGRRIFVRLTERAGRLMDTHFSRVSYSP